MRVSASTGGLTTMSALMVIDGVKVVRTSAAVLSVTRSCSDGTSPETVSAAVAGTTVTSAEISTAEANASNERVPIAGVIISRN